MESAAFSTGVISGMEMVSEQNQRRGTFDWEIGIGTLACTKGIGNWVREWNKGFAWGIALAADMAFDRQHQTAFN